LILRTMQVPKKSKHFFSHCQKPICEFISLTAIYHDQQSSSKTIDRHTKHCSFQLYISIYQTKINKRWKLSNSSYETYEAYFTQKSNNIETISYDFCIKRFLDNIFCLYHSTIMKSLIHAVLMNRMKKYLKIAKFNSAISFIFQ